VTRRERERESVTLLLYIGLWVIVLVQLSRGAF